MEYEFLPIETNESSIKEIANLLRCTFPKSKKYSDSFIDWQYKQNPNGKVIGFNAFYDGKLVAHYATIPFEAIIFGKQEKGLLSLNTATNEAHQGKKLFTTLAEMTYKKATNEGFKFVVGVANANSTHGFVSKLGFQLVGKLEAKLGFGKIIKKANIVTYDFSNCWNATSLAWRLKNPEANYAIKNNAIYSATETLGIKAILTDTTIENNNTQIGFRPIKLWIGIDKNIDWKKSNYFDIPQRFRPSPLNLIFKDLTDSNSVLNYNNIQFNAIDFDAF